MSVPVRLATAADVTGVVRVVRAVYDEYGFIWDPAHYHADLYHLDEHYLDKGHAFWVAEDDSGSIIGTAAVKFFRYLPGEPGTSCDMKGVLRLAGCDCSLERLYVHSSARRQGAGRALLQTCLQEGRRRGCSNVEIWSDKRFLEAHRLYRSFGAVPVAERICHDPDQSPEWGLLIRL